MQKDKSVAAHIGQSTNSKEQLNNNDLPNGQAKNLSSRIAALGNDFCRVPTNWQISHTDEKVKKSGTKILL